MDVNQIIEAFRGQTGADIPIPEFMSRTGLSIQQVCDLANSRKVTLGNWASTLDRAAARFGRDFIIARDGINQPYDGRPLNRDDYPKGYVRVPQKSMSSNLRCSKCGGAMP